MHLDCCSWATYMHLPEFDEFPLPRMASCEPKFSVVRCYLFNSLASWFDGSIVYPKAAQGSQKPDKLMRQQAVNGKHYERYFENHSMPCCADSSIAFLSFSLLQSFRSAKPWIWSSYSCFSRSMQIHQNRSQLQRMGQLTLNSCGTSVFFAIRSWILPTVP